MIASAAASRSIAACRRSPGNPETIARAMSTASGPSSMTPTVAGMPDSRSRSMVFCAARSASSRVEDGSLTPAVTTTRRTGSVVMRGVLFGMSFGLMVAARSAPARRARLRSRSCSSCFGFSARVITWATCRAWIMPMPRWVSTPAGVSRMRQARPSSGSSRRSTRPFFSSRAIRRDIPGWVSSTSSHSSLIRSPSGAVESA